MYRIVFLTIVAFVAADLLGEDEDLRKCRRFLHPHLMRCCNVVPKDKSDFSSKSDLKECFDNMSRGPPTCARDLCIAKKKGFATDDGKLDLSKLEEIITKEFEEEPNLLDAIKTNCIDGDLNMYGPPDFCDFMKMKHCLSVQRVIQCPEWNDTGNCKGTKELVEECAKMYS